MKRTLSFFLALVFVLSAVPFTIGASSEGGISIQPFASYYFSAYNIQVIPLGNGRLEVVASVNATKPMSKLGFAAIILYDQGGNMLASGGSQYVYNKGSYSYAFIYQGVAGAKYYASAAYFAQDSNGSDTRGLSSAYVTAT